MPPLLPIARPLSSPRVQTAVYERRLLVRIGEVQTYLRVSAPVAVAILAELHIEALPGNRYDLRQIWKSTWGIGVVPEEGIGVMTAPLLTVAEVAEVAGVSEKTIRRAGDNRDPRWALPRHHDFGPRIRRYLDPLVRAWAYQIEPAPWLLPAPRKPVLPGGLVVKTTTSSSSQPSNGHPRT